MKRLSSAIVLAFVLLTAAGCGERPPSFHALDITGADYGHGFSLTDAAGRTRQLIDFRGKVVVLFFGYVQCPDVCPSTLANLAEVMRHLGADADRIQVLFVTLDPQRDTPQLLAEYVPAFDRRFVGLYGDVATTDRVAKDFKVFYQRRPGVTESSYTIDHTAASYVFDTTGRLRLYVRSGENVDELVADLRQLLGPAVKH